MTYEKQVGNRLEQWLSRGELHGQVLRGQWFQFQDNNGFGVCQTDILIVTQNFVYILECKLTQNAAALVQLRDLYRPIVEKCFGRPAILVQVCRTLRHPPAAGFLQCITQLLDRPSTHCIYTWHFLGHATPGAR